MIRLNASKCIRLLHKNIECNKCETICPVQAITIGNKPLPSIDTSLCVGCGACDGVCPTEAFSLNDFNPVSFVYDFVQKNDNLISCKKNVPCICALNVEYIISLAILNKEIIFDMGYCDNCNIASKCKPQILKNYEEASYVLEAMQSQAIIKLENVCYKDDNVKDNARKNLFHTIIKTPFEKEVLKTDDRLFSYILKREDNALLKQKTVHEKTKILLTALKKMNKPNIYHVVDALELSFVSSKLMNADLCTACRMCYIVCPTGALTSNIRNSKIDFDSMLCVKCNACHEVCEPDALTLSPSFNIKEFFVAQAKNLILFDVRNCEKCGMIFSTNSDENFCPRCRVRI